MTPSNLPSSRKWANTAFVLILAYMAVALVVGHRCPPDWWWPLDPMRNYISQYAVSGWKRHFIWHMMWGYALLQIMLAWRIWNTRERTGFFQRRILPGLLVLSACGVLQASLSPTYPAREIKPTLEPITFREKALDTLGFFQTDFTPQRTPEEQAAMDRMARRHNLAIEFSVCIQIFCFACLGILRLKQKPRASGITTILFVTLAAICLFVLIPHVPTRLGLWQRLGLASLTLLIAREFFDLTRRPVSARQAQQV